MITINVDRMFVENYAPFDMALTDGEGKPTGGRMRGYTHDVYLYVSGSRHPLQVRYTTRSPEEPIIPGEYQGAKVELGQTKGKLSCRLNVSGIIPKAGG